MNPPHCSDKSVARTCSVEPQHAKSNRDISSRHTDEKWRLQTSNAQHPTSNEDAGGGARTHTALRPLDFESMRPTMVNSPKWHLQDACRTTNVIKRHETNDTKTSRGTIPEHHQKGSRGCENLSGQRQRPLQLHRCLQQVDRASQENLCRL